MTTDALAPYALPLRRQGDAAIVDGTGETVLVIDPDRHLENDEDAARLADRVFAMLTAAPVREEGGAVDRAGLTAELHDYLIAARRKKSLTIPKDLGRRLLAALATREEAPAEEGEPCEHQPGCDCTVAEEDVARSKPPLSAQPQAREEAQPVACGGCGAKKPSDRCLGCFHDFYTTPPAPEAEKLRVAVEAIRAEIHAPLSGPTHGAWDRGRIAGLKEALAALQQEGR